MRAFSQFNRLISGVFAAVILGICLFSGISSLGLTGPDEPRYAFIAREMSRTGDWITPRLYGQPWFEKPALYYWAAGAAFRVFGGNEWPARLPSALAALITALALAWTAKNLYGSRAAWLALLVFPTTAAGIVFSHSATPDMLFSTALALAMVVAAEILRRDGHFSSDFPPADIRGARVSLYAFFGLALGLATLAKGPAALILAGGSLVLWALATSQWQALWRFFHPAGIFSFAVVALPWYILCSLRNPDFFRTFIFLHNFQRYLTPVFQHRQPFWFFVPITFLALLPWSPVLFWVITEGILLCRLRTLRRSAFLLFSIWAIFPILFFSASQSKLPGYILPAIPALTLLIAQCCAGEMPVLGRFASLRPKYAVASLGAAWILLALSAHFSSAHIPAALRPGFASHLAQFTLVTILAGVVISFLALRDRTQAARALSCLCTAHAVIFAAFLFLPRADTILSARRLAQSLRDEGLSSATVQVCGVRRDWRYGLNFYLSTDMPECPSFPSVPPAQPAFLVVNEAGLAQLRVAGLDPRILNQDSQEAILVVLAPSSR